jgi:hypothetical protein
MRAKPVERAKARGLRLQGVPMKVIAARLGVSSASVHNWTADIELTPELAQRIALEAQALRTATWEARNRARRERYQREGRERARRGEWLHRTGCMLYWAEGSKSRNTVVFANSDVHMMRLFVRFLRECFAVDPSRLTVRLNAYTSNGLSIEEIQDYWLKALHLPRTSLRKHIVNHYPTSTSGRKRNKLPHGVCCLKLGDTRIVQHIYGAIQEYGGFEEPRWLDGPPIKRRPAVR